MFTMAHYREQKSKQTKLNDISVDPDEDVHGSVSLCWSDNNYVIIFLSTDGALPTHKHYTITEL